MRRINHLQAVVVEAPELFAPLRRLALIAVNLLARLVP
jgi:hypothetical protein